MEDVFDRVRAMPVVLDLLPPEPAAGSPFDQDASLVRLATYDVVRTRLQDAVARLLLAGRLANQESQSRYGTHLIVLRPAIVTAAKGTWLVATDDAVTRAMRACAVVADDRAMGAKAMRRATANGGLETFERVGEVFDRAHKRIVSMAQSAGLRTINVPPDTTLIMWAAQAVDQYYGSRDAISDALLLWNGSSSLAHGERWYADLTHRQRRRQAADILTRRGFDITCSVTNTLALRVLQLASVPAASRPELPAITRPPAHP